MRHLWCAVLLQALREATGGRVVDANHPGTVSLARHQAVLYFRGPSPDLPAVCDFAGFDPSRVREVALAAIDSGAPLRTTRQFCRGAGCRP